MQSGETYVELKAFVTRAGASAIWPGSTDLVATPSAANRAPAYSPANSTGRVHEPLEEFARSCDGRVSLPVAQAGVPLTCVDAMRAMLDRLKTKLQDAGLSADVVNQDIRELRLGRTFRLAIIPFNSFSEIVDERDRETVLRRLHEHVASGGRLIVTLRNQLPAWRTVDGQVRVIGSYAGPAEGSRLIVSVGMLPSRLPGVVDAKQFYDLYDADGRLIGKRLLELSFALIQPADFERQAAAAGFKVEEQYGDYDRSPFDPGRSPYFICLLRAT